MEGAGCGMRYRMTHIIAYRFFWANQSVPLRRGGLSGLAFKCARPEPRRISCHISGYSPDKDVYTPALSPKTSVSVFAASEAPREGRTIPPDALHRRKGPGLFRSASRGPAKTLGHL